VKNLTKALRSRLPEGVRICLSAKQLWSRTFLIWILECNSCEILILTYRRTYKVSVVFIKFILVFLRTAGLRASNSGRNYPKDAFDRIELIEDNEQTSDNENQQGDHHLFRSYYIKFEKNHTIECCKLTKVIWFSLNFIAEAQLLLKHWTQFHCGIYWCLH